MIKIILSIIILLPLLWMIYHMTFNKKNLDLGDYIIFAFMEWILFWIFIAVDSF